MEEFKGTKGEWKLMPGGFTKSNPKDMIAVYATNADLEIVCYVYQDGILHKRVQDHLANANLISTSPQMLELLQEFMVGWEWRKHNIPEQLDRADYEFKDKVEAVINKALGLKQ